MDIHLFIFRVVDWRCGDIYERVGWMHEILLKELVSERGGGTRDGGASTGAVRRANTRGGRHMERAV